MKLPSIQQLVEHSTRTFSRFPFALTSAIVGTGAWLALIDRWDSDQLNFLQALSMVGMLGISLFTAIALLSEKLRATPRTALLANLAGVTALAAYFFSLPEKVFDSYSAHIIRYVLFGAGLHFFIAVGPFFPRGEVNGFWQFNRSLFLRFLTASLYSSVLYLGLAAAILAVDQLFDAHIDGKRYGELWVFIVGIFNTWFFLSGVPDDLDRLEAETSYPKGLKIFTQYILLPLVSIYLIILYAYELKIIAEWDWPKGWVGYLVLVFSILGILSLLLVHPIKDRIENAWIRTISKYFYVALVPLVGLLLLAIWRRTSEYGLTERRYFVIVLGAWLAAMIVYFLFSKTKSIKIIPATLCAIAFVSSVGPWGAMGLSESVQVARLSAVLTRTGVLKDGKIRKAIEKLPVEDCRRVSSIVRYLNEVHGLGGIQPWFDVNLDTVGTSQGYTRYSLNYSRPPIVVAMMGVTYLDEWQTAVSKTLTYQSVRAKVVDIRGFSHMIQDVSLSQWDSVKTINANEVEWKVNYHPSAMTLSLTRTKGNAGVLLFDLKPMMASLESEYGEVAYANVTESKMSTEQRDARSRVRISFRSITVQKSGEGYQGNYLQGDFFVGPTGK